MIQKVTIKLIQESVDALDELIALEGNSATDTVNRALQSYAFLVREIKAGSQIFVQNDEGVRKVNLS